MSKKSSISQYEKLLSSLESNHKRFENLATNRLSSAIKHLPVKENLIKIVWKECSVVMEQLMNCPSNRQEILSMLASHRQSKWMTLLDKLTTLDHVDNTLVMNLLAILLQELISKEKACQPFWTPVYKELSDKLLLPTEIGYADLDSISSDLSLKSKAERLQSLMMNTTRVQSKNLQKTYYQLSTSTVVDKWVSDPIESEVLKAVKIRLRLSNAQKSTIDEWIATSMSVYNKTLDAIKSGHPINFMSLRDLLVTSSTKKTSREYTSFDETIKRLYDTSKKLKVLLKTTKSEAECKNIQTDITRNALEIKNINAMRRLAVKNIAYVKNPRVSNSESFTPKEIRAGAVEDVCKAYKTGFSQLKSGLIKHFNLGYKDIDDPNKCISIAKSMISINDGVIRLAPTFFENGEGNFRIHPKTLENIPDLSITHDCRLVCQHNKYYLLIPQKCEILERKIPLNYCGIDPGVRTFMTTFGNCGCEEYDANNTLINKLDTDINKLKWVKRKKHLKMKTKRGRKKARKERDTGKRVEYRIRKRALTKRDVRKTDIVNDLHWKTITSLLSKHDVIFYGDIKSHSIVKDGPNKNLNRSMNNLKFYKFKTRLLYKAQTQNKLVFCVGEAYTTKTCSNCGTINDPGSSKVYKCDTCRRYTGRDVNASKNILMKGIVENLI